MSRIKRNQNIDDLIRGIKVITENQCSLSEQDQMILNEALKKLHFLKRKKGRTNEQVLDEVVKIVGSKATVGFCGDRCGKWSDSLAV